MKPHPSTALAGSCSLATSTPMAIGRSRAAPPLRTPVGARLTVTRCRVHVRPLDSTAARTRSLDSRQAASGSPTTLKAGRPPSTWTSTDTDRPRTPSRVAEGMLAITGSSSPWRLEEGPVMHAGRSRARSHPVTAV